jgi:hypothetical protein
MEHDDYVVLLLEMRHGFIIDSLAGSQAMLPGLVKMNHQGPLYRKLSQACCQ